MKVPKHTARHYIYLIMSQIAEHTAITERIILTVSNSRPTHSTATKDSLRAALH